MITENKEGLQEFNIVMPEHREEGISAMLRLKNEEEWIRPCLESIQWMDEIVCCFQNSTDRTEKIVREFQNVKIYYYPFDSHPNGPGHKKVWHDSVYSRAYFYNWCLSKTTKTVVSKWDGDMVAFDWLGDAVRNLLDSHDIIRSYGVDMCGAEIAHTSAHPWTADEPRFFRVTDETYYVTGEKTEWFTKQREGMGFKEPGYMHFKWAKSLESASKAWPVNWREVEHFTRIYANKARPCEVWAGEYPTPVKRMLDARS